jgi:hypothetical protein
MPSLRSLSLLLPLLLLFPTSLAQPKPDQKRASPPRVIEFADESVVLESAGLTIPIPLGASSERTRVGTANTVKIIGRDTTWQLNVQTPRFANPDATPASVLEDLVVALFEQSGQVYDATPGQARLIAYKGRIVEPMKEISLPSGLPAQRIYITFPPDGVSNDPAKQVEIIRGYTVIKVTSEQYLSFELITPRPDFERNRPTYEAIIAGCAIEDPTMANASRKAAIDAGARILRDLSESDLTQLIKANGERWERLHMPSQTDHDSDATEKGYRRFKASIGPSPLSRGSGEDGFLLKINARLLMEDSVVCDSEGVYFLGKDRSRESWTVKNTIRDLNPNPQARKKPMTTTEFGSRDGKSVSVRIDGETGKPLFARPIIEGDGYISQIEAWLLPQVLVRSGIATDFAFYQYRSEKQQISFRRDDVTQPADTPNVWIIRSRMSDRGLEQVMTLNSKGQPLRTVLPDKSVWEPTTVEKLTRLWKDKGLPVD